MILKTLLLYLTLVVSAQAATTRVSVDVSHPSAQSDPDAVAPHEGDYALTHTTNLTPVAPTTLAPQVIEYVPPRDHEMTPRVGFYGGNDKYDTLFGLSYAWRYHDDDFWRLGVDSFLKQGSGLIELGWQRLLMPWEKKFHPFTRAGFKTRFIGKEGMATFVNFNNFQLALAAGVEFPLARTWAMQTSLEGATGLRFRSLIFSLGLSHSF